MKRRKVIAALCLLSMLGGIFSACAKKEEETKKKKSKKDKTEASDKLPDEDDEDPEESTKKGDEETTFTYGAADGDEEPDDWGGAPADPPASSEEESNVPKGFVESRIFSCCPFSEGRAWVQFNEPDARYTSWGLIDQDGYVLYSSQYVMLENTLNEEYVDDGGYGWRDMSVSYNKWTHFLVKNGITYVNLDPYSYEENNTCFVILDKDGNELFSMDKTDSESYFIANRINDTFLVAKNVATMSENTTSLYLIDKNGNQIGNTIVEGNTDDVRDTVLSLFNGPIVYVDRSQEGLPWYEVDPNTGALSPYEMKPRDRVAWGYNGWTKEVIGEDGNYTWVDCDTITPPKDLSISSAYRAGDNYLYIISGADGKQYIGLADMTGSFLYDPIQYDGNVFTINGEAFEWNGYIALDDGELVSPTGERLSSFEQFKSLPSDFCMPGAYCYSQDWIREGFISYYWFNRIKDANDEYMESGYVSLDGKKTIVKVLIREK